MTNDDIEIETVRLDELHELTGNPRTHDAKNIAAIAGSIIAFGQVEPLVVQRSTGTIVGGNGRLTAMRDVLGWESCRVVKLDLTDEQAKALAVTLNRTAELGGWDMDRLPALVNEMDEGDFDIDELGWEPGDLTSLIGGPPGIEEQSHPPDDVDHPEMGKPIALTVEQRAVFDLALARMREREGPPPVSEGRCCEFLAADWLNTPVE